MRIGWAHKCPTPGEQAYLTPPSLRDQYTDWFDPAPHPRPPEFDGLKVDWGQKAFVNPPWRSIRPWVEKALEERAKGCTIHMLLPVAPNTRVFHALLFPNCQIQWLRGEVKFTRVTDGKIVNLPACLAKFEPLKAENSDRVVDT